MEPGAEALEWAIALSKAPAERVVLRQRPLPGGMLSLLQIAAGSNAESLEKVSAATGEDAENVQEAARFYVREVMFHQGADAYRVLGVEHDASSDALRAHYRLLQQWLHPDRQTSDWDAIFASRVNAAWSQVRSDERRAAYDLEHRPRKFDGAEARGASLPWQISEAASPAPWRRRIPAFALFAVCAVLGVLAVRDMQREPEILVSQDQDNQVLIQIPGEADKAPAAKDIALVPERTQSPAPAKRVAKGSSSERVEAVASTVVEVPAKPEQTLVATPEVQAKSSMQRAPVVAVVEAANPGPPLAAPVANRDATSRIAKLPEPLAGAPAPAVKNEKHVGVVETRQGERQPVLAHVSSVPLRRMQEAQRVGGVLINFMTTQDAAIPPIWNSLVTQRGATQLRNDLLVKGARRGASPTWRVGEDEAAMHADIRYQDGQSGRLTAELVWREQRWLVNGLSIERDL